MTMFLQSYNMRNFHSCFLIVLLLAISSCTKDKLGPTNVYPDETVTDIAFGTDAPQPAIVSEGTTVKYMIKGLDKEVAGSYKFFINQTEASIVEVTSTYITVKVPVSASSGGAAVVLSSGQLYYGPNITVRGKTQIDDLFYNNIATSRAVNQGAIGGGAYINGILDNGSGQYIIYGNFNRYSKDAFPASNITSNIQVIDANGVGVQAAANAINNGVFVMGTKGLNGPVTHVRKTSSNEYVVVGGFSSYDTINNVNGIARFSTTSNNKPFMAAIYNVANPNPDMEPQNSWLVGSAINGGVIGLAPNRVFFSADGRYILSGNFGAYASVYYPNSTKNSTQFDFIEAFGITKMYTDGSFDSTFNYNAATKKSYGGPNGLVLASVQLTSGEVILGGAFTSFHGVAAGGLVAINPGTGQVSNVFNGHVDGPVSSITYNEVTDRLVIVGNFKHYNGVAVNGVAVVKENGSLDTDILIKPATGGVVTYCAQLNNGSFIISGTFSKYNGVVRSGFAVLDTDGNLKPGYNNTGLFRGQLTGHIEVPALNGVALFLVGQFDKFDNKEVGNIVKIVLSN